MIYKIAPDQTLDFYLLCSRPPTVDTNIPALLTVHVAFGARIQAIKVIRSALGCSLIDAKHIWDRIWEETRSTSTSTYLHQTVDRCWRQTFYMINGSTQRPSEVFGRTQRQRYDDLTAQIAKLQQERIELERFLNISDFNDVNISSPDEPF